MRALSTKTFFLWIVAFAVALAFNAVPAIAADKKPNIVFIMRDDVGMWNIGAYHRGLMAGRTPHIDTLAGEGAIFTDYYAEASCTAGRANFITGELPIRFLRDVYQIISWRAILDLLPESYATESTN